MTLRSAFGPFGPVVSMAAFCAIFGAAPALAADAEADGEAIVAEAVQFAQESPEPDPSELYTDVYVEA